MKRREFISLMAGVAVWPLAARADLKRSPVIGFLNGASYGLSEHLVRAFRQGLSEEGFVEGKNVTFEYRSAEGIYTTLPGLAADLVSHQVDLLAATGTPTGLPAKAATAAIPIVFVTGSDPVQQGLVQHLNHPGGNLTGATTLAVEMGQKRLQLLRDLLPQAGAFGALINPVGPNVEPLLEDVREAARIDGAGLLREFRAITLPLLGPYFELALLLGVIYVLQLFGEIFVATQGGPGSETTTLPYYVYQTISQANDVGTSSAQGVLAIVFASVIAALLLRLLARTFRRSLA